MKLKALHSIKGLKKNDEYTLPGEIFDAKGKQAADLIAAGAAEEVAVVIEQAPKSKQTAPPAAAATDTEGTGEGEGEEGTDENQQDGTE